MAKIKMKSHKASRKRIRLTAKGKLLRTQINVRHLLTHRSPKRLRQLHKKTVTTTTGYVRRARIAFLQGVAGRPNPGPGQTRADLNAARAAWVAKAKADAAQAIIDQAKALADNAQVKAGKAAEKAKAKAEKATAKAAADAAADAAAEAKGENAKPKAEKVSKSEKAEKAQKAEQADKDKTKGKPKTDKKS
ncbi:MAG TPA: 50S ribosomal protein L35 [Planctomycetota bacterium]|nr:50S ribosomal protein L35 [Planctomycetota bacterium]